MGHVLYFVGAGLSKALERTPRRVPLMTDFVGVLSDYLDDDVVLFTLAALELEGVFEETRPEWLKMAEEIQKGLDQRACSPKLREDYRNVLKNRPAENVEALLERSRNNRIRFSFAINRIFAAIGWNATFNPLEKFLSSQFRRPDTRHTFVSFNYDLLLDRCVQRLSNGRWSIRHGYGFEIDQFIPPDEAAIHMRQFPQPWEGIKGGFYSVLATKSLPGNGDETFTILKPHGSLNWLVPFEGNYKFMPPGATVIACAESDGSVAYYPEFTCNSLEEPEGTLHAQLGAFLVPPTSSKISNMQFIETVREHEWRAIASADEIYVLGWSMPKTDADQANFIRRGIEDRQQELSRLTVVNYDASPEYFDYAACLFGVRTSHAKVFNAGFRSFVERMPFENFKRIGEG